MALNNTKELELEKIKYAFNIKQNRIDNLPIAKSELEEIYRDFQRNIPKLEGIKSKILAILNDKLEGNVHSIRCRIKDKDHLIEKIIRNAFDKPDKYEKLCADNYNKIITDLIGVRIIILDKRDWKEIHNSLLKIFRNIPERYAIKSTDIVTNYDKYQENDNSNENILKNSYHAEKPVVYITSEDDRKLYQDDYLKVDNSKTHYRSIHYIIRYGFIYFEIQVRTLFEEGWLEFDHRIKYPCDQNNKKKQEYTSVLSSLAVAADRLISFYDEIDFPQETCNDLNQVIPENTADTSGLEKQSLEGKMIQVF